MQLEMVDFAGPVTYKYGEELHFYEVNVKLGGTCRHCALVLSPMIW